MAEAPKLDPAHLFRRKHGEILGALCRRFGYRHIEILEEAVMEAFLAATERWPYGGIPANPAGWLYVVARNKAVDALRRAARESGGTVPDAPSEESQGEPTDDDLMLMILLCCNPPMSDYARLCIILKTVCGFSVAEIARALQANPEAIKRNISRARKAVAFDAFEKIEAESVRSRFAVVLEVLYAMFNEGYAASSGEAQLRRELAEEAVRLTDLMIASGRVPDEYLGETHALLALMLFQSSRFAARTAGEIPVLLEEQDRSLWDRDLIAGGVRSLDRSRGTRTSAYHVEARIAAEHCLSATFAETDWLKILELYDTLLTYKDSPAVRINRAVAVFFGRGPAAADQDLNALRDTLEGSAAKDKSNRFLFHCLRARIASASGDTTGASHALESALPFAPTVGDGNFVRSQLKKIRPDVPLPQAIRLQENDSR